MAKRITIKDDNYRKLGLLAIIEDSSINTVIEKLLAKEIDNGN